MKNINFYKIKIFREYFIDHFKYQQKSISFAYQNEMSLSVHGMEVEGQRITGLEQLGEI